MNDPTQPSVGASPTATESENPYEAPPSATWQNDPLDQTALDVVGPLWQASGWMRFVGVVMMACVVLVGIGLYVAGVMLVGAVNLPSYWPFAIWLLVFASTILVGWTGYLVWEAGNHFKRGGQLGALPYFRHGLRSLAKGIHLATLLTMLVVGAAILMPAIHLSGIRWWM